MNILIISHYFQPHNHIASNRINAMYKYLGEENNVFVLTLDRNLNSERYENVYEVSNSSLLKRATFVKKQNFVQHNIKALYNHLLNRIPGIEDRSWIKSACKKGADIVLEENIDVVISSYGPISTVNVGIYLKEKFPNLKLILDIRDDFTIKNYISLKKANLSKLVDAFSSVSEPILNNLKENFPDKRIKYYKYMNGYNFELKNPVRRVNNIFTITYTGSFYGAINPDNFLQAISELKNENQLINFKVKFIGSARPIHIPINIKENVIQKNERIPYIESVNELSKADLLLLILPTQEKKGVYSGKIFDYLGSLRPILALVPNDVAKELIDKTRSGYICPNEDVEMIKREILNSYIDWMEVKPFSPNIELIRNLHRRELTHQFNSFLNQFKRV